MQLRHQPAVIALSRQALPTFDRRKYASASGVARGAYVMADVHRRPAPQIILIASGSEVALAVDAHESAGVARSSLPRRLHAVVGHLRAASRSPIARRCCRPG